MYGKSLKLVQFSIKIIQLTLNITELYQFYQHYQKFTNELFCKNLFCIKFIEEKLIHCQHLYPNLVTIRITPLQHYSLNCVIHQTSSEKY